MMREFLYEHFVMIRDFIRNPRKAIDAHKEIKTILAEKERVISFDDRIIRLDLYQWRKILCRFAYANPENSITTAHSLKEDIILAKKLVPFDEAEDAVTYVCIVKNDLKRIQKALEHHRNIGVKNFVFIDNGSDDGTFEWLLKQEVNVFHTTAKFCTAAKSAWLAMIFEYFGYNHWYLVLDSDELFSYPKCENKKIEEFVEYLKENKISRTLAFMLDMYQKGELVQLNSKKEWTIEEYRYFDVDTYQRSKNLHYQKITGGPRERIFKSDNGIVMLQNKYPLVYMQRGELYRYHYVYPFYHNFDSDCISVLLHYKFLPGDIEKYKEIAKQGNYANGSQLYKDSLKVLRNNEHVSFWNNKSVELKSSEDLHKIEILEDIRWNNDIRRQKLEKICE